jgi:hypothetical protein
MEISKYKFERYLAEVTDIWIAEHDMPADELSEYDSHIENMKLHAEKAGELEALKLGFEEILTHPDINTEELTGSHFTWSDEQVREIIAYAYQKI